MGFQEAYLGGIVGQDYSTLLSVLLLLFRRRFGEFYT